MMVTDVLTPNRCQAVPNRCDDRARTIMNHIMQRTYSATAINKHDILEGQDDENMLICMLSGGSHSHIRNIRKNEVYS